MPFFEIHRGCGRSKVYWLLDGKSGFLYFFTIPLDANISAWELKFARPPHAASKRVGRIKIRGQIREARIVREYCWP